LIAVAIVAIIVVAGIFVLIAFNSVNHATSSSQTNFSTFSFQVTNVRTQTNVSVPNLVSKASFASVAAITVEPKYCRLLPP
jgi:hypothetical protein